MNVFSADYLREFATDYFVACGLPLAEAQIVADHLVESNLMGYDSHGIVRCVEYLTCIRDGRVRLDGQMKIVKEGPATAIFDCGLKFGQVTATAIVDIACEKARRCGIACVVSQNCFHVGRLGSYVQKVAERGLFGLLACNLRKWSHVVVPYGGREGRISSNPLAFGAPTKGWPVVLDMSTSTIAVGKIDVALLEGKQLPEGCLQDADGNPTTDPTTFYDPQGVIRGTVLPLGSPRFGYKGYGLSMMVEILGGILSGDDSTADLIRSNGLSLIVIDPDHFCGADLFRELVDRFCAYQMSSKPAKGFEEVVVPGVYDFRLREKRLAEGIPVDEKIWERIVRAAAEIGVRPREPDIQVAGVGTKKPAQTVPSEKKREKQARKTITQ
jgi:hydroxycarboxylate dehydrogenase B